MSDNYTKIDRFEEFGFLAGYFRKAGWKHQDDIYKNLTADFEDRDIKLVIPMQTHSAEISLVDGRSPGGAIRADGSICKSGAFCLTVRTADCVPLLAVDPAEGLFAAVHVGWRGLASGIIEEFVRKAKSMNSTPSNMHFHLGPAIGQCCFEVGDEVAALFPDDCENQKNGRAFADMRKLTRNKLREAGVDLSKVSSSDECTSCDKERFYSYRRDGEAPIQMVSCVLKI